MTERDVICEKVREISGRPVRWAAAGETTLADFEGRDWTLEVFDVEAADRPELLRSLWGLRKQVRRALRRSLLFVFHSPEATERHFASVRGGTGLIDSAHLGRPRFSAGSLPALSRARRDRDVFRGLEIAPRDSTCT